MPLAKLKNIDIYYEIHGEGKPLVMVAGYTCDHTFWNPMLNSLTKHFQTLIFDNRAIGQTKDTNDSFTLETMAEDTMALIQYLHLVQPVIIGQSMGGAIAQIIAHKFSEQISKLVIMNSTTKFNMRTLKAIESLLNLRKNNLSFDLLVETGMPWFFSSDYLAKSGNIGAFKENLQNNPYPQSLEDQERQFKALQSFDSQSWLSEINNPTQIIAAEDDIIATVSESQRLAKDIKGAKLRIIPGGHSSSLEQAESLNQIISNFL
jgi:pimeloyl-ACP methyl ester carboxylesterase